MTTGPALSGRASRISPMLKTPFFPLLAALLLACLLPLSLRADPVPDPRLAQIRAQAAQILMREPDNRLARFRYAQASYQSGDHDPAKRQLLILMRSSQSAEELDELKAAYGTVLRARPWRFGVDLAILPSTNINKTSSNQIFDTPFGQFLIIDGGVEDSGVGFRLGGRASYDRLLHSGAVLSYGLEISRHHYPADRLNHLDGTLSLTWSQRGLGRQTRIIPYLRRIAYDISAEDGPDSTRFGLRLIHDHDLTPASTLSGALTLEQRDYDRLDQLDGPFRSAVVAYQGEIDPRTGYSLSFGLSQSLPQITRLRYRETVLSAELRRALGSFGVVGVNAGLQQRQYAGDFPALAEPRADRSRSIGLSVRSPHLRIGDLVPELSCEITQNDSNVALYEFRSTDCAVSFDHTF